MSRTLSLVYGVLCYLVFLGVLVYTIGFIGDFLVPKSLDTGATGPVWSAIAVDLGLIALFGLQHSIMARRGFKDRWTRLVPEPIERSTYVLAASLVLVLLFWLWRPLPAVVWELEASWAVWLLWGIYALGWLVVLAAAHMIDGFHLFGLRQVWDHARGREPTELEFQTPWLYKYVRHPLMTGFFLVFWATPRMTVGHVLFAGGMSLYIFVGVWFEERDLVDSLGDRYREYREKVPKLIPWPRRGEP